MEDDIDILHADLNLVEHVNVIAHGFRSKGLRWISTVVVWYGIAVESECEETVLYLDFLLIDENFVERCGAQTDGKHEDSRDLKGKMSPRDPWYEEDQDQDSH